MYRYKKKSNRSLENTFVHEFQKSYYYLKTIFNIKSNI